ncbi:DUF4374 domain-containing protein [Sphingobacterium sp. 40-24]|uniref:DUF4374 domain-containing protein n=1 Tax=Sphingobacterium sp. 40-24 TaxID=1895843 RepID=UPI00095BCCFB|nr:DUF4374 domain-containing protein [Sphingobacterium sp. 40-24]OJZ03313.1 MAG: hypothetical protein BGP15_19825 [Sphingobacterium sp. 40-24]
MLKSITKNVSLIALAGISLIGCSKSTPDNSTPTNPTEEVGGNFAIKFSTDNGSFMLPVKDLMSGTISPVGAGTDVTSMFPWEENVIQKGKYFYSIDPNAAQFGKYSFENGVLKAIKVIPFTKLTTLYIGWHSWLDDDRLAVGPRNSNEYAVINTNTMLVEASGTITSDTDIPKDHNMRIYAFLPQGNKIVLGYCLYNNITKVSYDVTYTGSVDYPSFKNFKKTGEDNRSAPVGPVRNGYFHKFKENGYTYLQTYTMPALGGGKNLPTGFYRIKDGDDKLDPNYFFNISQYQGGDNQLGVSYLGNGKALLISAHDTNNNVKEWNDWWYAAMWEYLIVDVNSQKVVKKLDFPLVSNSRSAVVINGNAYIAVNDPKAEAIYIWEYNPTTDKLTKGAKILGGDADTPMLYNLD